MAADPRSAPTGNAETARRMREGIFASDCSRSSTTP
jgi:hypothetical protein